MADRTQGFGCQLPALLLCWAVLFGTQVFNAHAIINYTAKITVDKYTKEVDNHVLKTLNISCYFDDRIPSVYNIQIDRWMPPDERTERLVQARLDDRNAGEVERMHTFGSEGGPDFSVLQGSVQQLWLNLELTNVTSADTGAYVCSLVYTLRHREDFYSVYAVYSYNEEDERVMLAASLEKAGSASGWKWNIRENLVLRYIIIAIYCILGLAFVGFAKAKMRRKPAPSSSTVALLEAAGEEAEAASPVAGPSGVQWSSSIVRQDSGQIPAESSSSMSTLSFDMAMEMKVTPIELKPQACKEDAMSTKL